MTEAVIKCDSVYKIFGADAKKMLQEANGNVDAKTFQEKGCIVGVNNASFEVSKGEMLVVMGLSGSGKSTLLRCISRLTDATDGKIFIEGQDLLSLKNKELIELRRSKWEWFFKVSLYFHIKQFWKILLSRFKLKELKLKIVLIKLWIWLNLLVSMEEKIIFQENFQADNNKE